MKNSKPYQIKDISEDAKELKDKLKSVLSSEVRHRMISKYCGLCSICSEIADKILFYDESDPTQKAKRVERYCDKCLEKEQIKNAKYQT